MAKRLRAAADFSVATVDRSVAAPALADARAHTVMLATWNVPHVAGRRDGDHDGHVGSPCTRNRHTQARLVAFDLTARTTRNVRPDYADQFERFFNRLR